MQNQWPQLNQFEYPGRFLIIGRTDASYYAIYGVTARSESSRAKRYIFDRENNTIKVEATDPEKMSQGNLDLLQYNAVRLFKNSIIIGNGKQTDTVRVNGSAIESLAADLNSQTFEPDKHRTPRITGMLLNDSGSVSAGLYLIKAGRDHQPKHKAYTLYLEPGQAYYISTYSGENIKPTPSFELDPLLLDINFKNAEDAAQEVYNHFAPQKVNTDLRVSVIAIEADLKLEEKSVAIINYNK